MPVVRSPLYTDVARLMADEGARVMLSGRLGDGTMANLPSDYGNLSGLLTGGQPGAFLQQAHAWSRASHDPIYKVLARSLAWFLPARLRVAAARATLLRSATRGHAIDAAAAISLAAPLRVDPLATVAFVDAEVHTAAPRNPFILKGVYEYAMLRRLQTDWTTPAVAASYPYADREVVELMTAAPFDVVCRRPAARADEGRARGHLAAASIGAFPKATRRRVRDAGAPALRRRLLDAPL